jgi:hypothetical protein
LMSIFGRLRNSAISKAFLKQPTRSPSMCNRGIVNHIRDKGVSRFFLQEG